MLCPNTSQIGKWLIFFFFSFLASRAETNRQLFLSMNRLALFREDAKFQKLLGVPHGTALQANTEVLNLRQRNQQLLLANEPWRLGILASWHPHGVPWAIPAGVREDEKKQVYLCSTRGVRIEESGFLVIKQIRAEPLLISSIFPSRGRTQEVGTNSGAHQNLLGNHGGDSERDN